VSEVAIPAVAVVGGSGLYAFLPDAAEVPVETPYGVPSEPLAVGHAGGRTVVFLPRHGRDHRFPPHRIPYRANMWALRSVGVRQVLAPCAVGSLLTELGPGSLVVPDQLVDLTRSRATSYHDTGAGHLAFADPYCPQGRAAVLAAAAASGWPARDGAVLAVIEGPRFNTRAESRLLAAQGMGLVNMTGAPEAALARELGLCYTSVCLVTDHDAGVDAGSAVRQTEVFSLFAEHTARLRALLTAVVAGLGTRAQCDCARAVDGLPPIR
jgi:5'-methylthioadenosine phosphorylase